jgi:hypothetical protein
MSLQRKNTDFPSSPLGRMNPTERGMKKKRQKKSVFLPTKHRFLGIFICHGQHGLTVLCA